MCSQPYSLEIIKGGTPVEAIDLTSKSFWVFGRLPQCDVAMEHPSLSRYHAVIQFCAVPTEKHPVSQSPLCSHYVIIHCVKVYRVSSGSSSF